VTGIKYHDAPYLKMGKEETILKQSKRIYSKEFIYNWKINFVKNG